MRIAGKALGSLAMGLCAWGMVLHGPMAQAGDLGEWRINGFLENDTRYRKDVGLSKERNTLRLEGDREFDDLGAFTGNSFTFKLRGTYDAVYDLNSDHYGKDAGGPICLEDTSGLIPAGCVAHGRGAFGGNNLQYGVFNGVPGVGLGQFGFNLANNPNDGMIVLGEPLHRPGGGVAFGVPVRPCDVDSRGCLGGYMDGSENDLRFPEFADADRLDWLREVYFDTSLMFSSPFSDDEQELFFRVGKQQVIWGRTDLFRVLDVINPVDYSRNNIYDELQDIRIPMWIATAEYRMGPVAALQDLNWQVVWNFDKFRPNSLGQCGTANVILDAGCFFRGMKNLWDNGGTVSNFALVPPILGQPGRAMTTDFGPNQVGIREVKLPNWTLSNTQIGTKIEGVLGDVSFSLNGLLYRSQLPSLHGGSGGPPAISPFANLLLPVDLQLPELLPGVGQYNTTPRPVPYLIAFDIAFPRVKLLGGSLDFTIAPIKTVARVEAAMTWGEEFPNTLRPELYSKSRVARYVVGLDRLTFIPFLNADRTFLFSLQIFGQHLLDHELEQGRLGQVGMPDWKDNWTGTLFIQTWYLQDRLQPKFVLARDWKAGAYAVQPSVDFLLSQNFKVSFGANVKFGDGAQKFNDCRDCNPYPPFTAYASSGGPLLEAGPIGLTGFEPLGRFRQGPLGSSDKEDEVFITLGYQFF